MNLPVYVCSSAPSIWAVGQSAFLIFSALHSNEWEAKKGRVKIFLMSSPPFSVQLMTCF